MGIFRRDPTMSLRSKKGGTYMLTINSKKVYTEMIANIPGYWQSRRMKDGAVLTCYVFDHDCVLQRDEISIIIDAGDYLMPNT